MPENNNKLEQYKTSEDRTDFLSDKYGKKDSKEFIESLKKECSICGDKNCRLIFHHPNPENKVCSISKLANHSKKRILEEVKKCIVVCDKCHNKIHKEDRMNGVRALNDKYNCKIKVETSQGFMQGLRNEKLEALCKKYINKKPSKKFIDSVKSQGWYQVECPECGFSNRKWLEAGKDAFYYPIEVEEISTKTKLRILYFCRNCNISWEG